MRSAGRDHIPGFIPRRERLPPRGNPVSYRRGKSQCAMIAVVRRWSAVLSALLFLLPLPSTAADDPAGAARELARKTVAFAGKGAAVTVTWRSLSSRDQIPPAARTAFEAGLLEAGMKFGETAPSVELHLTLSESETQFLLVEEAAKGDDRQVWIAGWKRPGTAGVSGVAASI